MSRTFFVSLVCSSYFCLPPAASASDTCKSGLDAGKKPGPYSAVIATGPRRGQSFCYICETGAKPAVVVFARRLSDNLGKLVKGLDVALSDHKKAELQGWVTFLAEDPATLEGAVVKWGQKHGIGTVPLGVFSDAAGPPSYRLAKEADVTVLLFVKQKVVANFAFRPDELTSAQAIAVLKAIPKLVEKK